MTTKEAIYQLEDLIKDRESFQEQGIICDICKQDISALTIAIGVLKSMKTFTVEKPTGEEVEINLDAYRLDVENMREFALLCTIFNEKENPFTTKLAPRIRRWAGELQNSLAVIRILMDKLEEQEDGSES